MRYQLDLIVRHTEGALIRVLGTTERRGFRPLSLDGEARPTDEHIRLRMVVEGDRSDEALVAQLAKLHDCVHVQAAACP